MLYTAVVCPVYQYQVCVRYTGDPSIRSAVRRARNVLFIAGTSNFYAPEEEWLSEWNKLL